jgi:hypothetical protein
MKNSNDTSWNRTNDHPICSTAPYFLFYLFLHTLPVLVTAIFLKRESCGSKHVLLEETVKIRIKYSLTKVHFVSLQYMFILDTLTENTQNKHPYLIFIGPCIIVLFE